MATVVLLLGGECTGKTALAHALAQAASEQWSKGSTVVPEVLRDFVTRSGRTPHQHEQEGIWREQTELLNHAIAGNPESGLVICDPAPVMTAVYSIQYFDDDSLIDSAVAETDRGYLVVWCAPDLPWEPDGILRDGPEARCRSHEIIGSQVVASLETSKVIRVDGAVEDRVAKVLAHLH